MATANYIVSSRALAAAKPKRLRFGEAGSGNPGIFFDCIPAFAGTSGGNA